MAKQYSLKFLLISLAFFLIFPSFSFGENFEEITPGKIENYLQLSEKDAVNLLDSLIQAFTTEWIYLKTESARDPTEEESLVPLVLRKAVRIQVLNHLLIDAPIEMTWKLINNAVKIARLLGTKDISVILEELEKESVKKAVNYGMSVLLQNEIRVTPGVIKFGYQSNKGWQEVDVQYIMIYRPLSSKRGQVGIRFYSPLPIEPPKSEGSYGGIWGTPHDVQGELPPFIAELNGRVEKGDFDEYYWIDEQGNRFRGVPPDREPVRPLIKITFPETVPDLGIRPLSFWERNVLKPIQTTIKEIEIVITKAIGKSPNIVENILKLPETAINIWNKIKSTVSQFNPFGAGVVQNLPSLGPEGEEIEEIEPLAEVGPPQITEEEKEELKKKELQEIIDDLLERIDLAQAEIARLIQEREMQKAAEKEKIKEETEEEEGEKDEEEELEESEETGQAAGQNLCEKISGVEPLRNEVIFNEIAWMGTEVSANHEWIELKNISGAEINLISWQILDKDGQIKAIFDVRYRISNNGFLLLERTSDESVPNVTADFIYTGALGNTNEALYLFDENCQLQDFVEANPNWLAGDNSSKRTMERKADFGWQTSLNPGGTPKTGNSSGYVIDTGGGGAPPPPAPPPPSYPKILISEIQIDSASNTNDEFIELYNPNEQEANLSNWSIQKSYSTSTTIYKKNFEENHKIQPQSYFLIVNASSSDQNLLNLAGLKHKTFNLAENNTIYLVANQEKIENPVDSDIIDKVGFGENVFSEGNPATNPPEGKSIGRKWSTTSQSYIDTDNNQNDFEIQNPTPKSQNQSPEPEPESETPLLAVVINEIAWMGTGTSTPNDEWLELYNNTTSTIDLADWRLVAADGTPSITFSTSSGTTTISALGFYLLERTNDQTISDILADRIYTGALGNGGEKLELRNAQGNLIDLVDASSGWFAGTTTPSYISMERINPRASGSSASNWANNNQITRNGLDENQNPINGTPRAQNSVYQSLPPNPVSDLAIDSQNSSGNSATLVWSTSTDPDTLSENLSYKIYYLKETFNENNLENASTSSTTATTITISNLDYNSTYYFGIKAFDGSNYSSLSTSSPYQTATLSTITTAFPLHLETRNNGRKTARASDGRLYVVYFKGETERDRIYLAESTDNGRIWQEIPVTPDENYDQGNPAMAIDSEDNLHLVWSGKVSATSTFQIRYRKYDGNSFSEVENLTNNENWNQETPVIAIDSQDDVHLVWVNNRLLPHPDGGYYWAPQILYRISVNGRWEETEETGGYDEVIINSPFITIDSQDQIHLVWSAFLRRSPANVILYQKRTAGWGEIIQLDVDWQQGIQSSMVVDSNDNVHIVWNSIGGYSDPDRAFHFYYIKYIKYNSSDDSWTEVERLSTNNRYQIFSPSISINSNNWIYVVWKGISEFISNADEVHQIKFSDSWGPIEIPISTDRSYYLRNINLFWNFYPEVSGVKTNQPKTGYAFVFYEGTDLKFYASQDLTWE